MGFSFHIFFFIFTYLWLHSVFLASRGLSLVVVRGGCSSLQWRASHCDGFSGCRAQALGARALVAAAHRLSGCGSQALELGSVIVAHELSCSIRCGIFPHQGSNPCPLHWQADSYHCAPREVPHFLFLLTFYCYEIKHCSRRKCYCFVLNYSSSLFFIIVIVLCTYMCTLPTSTILCSASSFCIYICIYWLSLPSCSL